jgi:RNA polymerase sigma-70 factor (ECF subfamily)
MLRHRQDAEDAAQESLVRAVRHLGNWDAGRPLVPWVLAIAANRCRTALERRGRRPAGSTEAWPEPVARPAPATSELAEELQRALAELRAEYQACFILFYDQHLSCLQISDVLGVPEGTVKTWLHRARKQLADTLRQRGFAPESHDELPRSATPSRNVR